MTERVKQQVAARTSLCLLVALVLFCVTSSDKIFVLAEPEPLTSSFVSFNDNLMDAESLILVNRLKHLTEEKHQIAEKAHEITDEQIEIQAMLEAKARERERAIAEQQLPDYFSEETEPEALPLPAARINHAEQPYPTKRQNSNGVSYMSLCHFKICNMGRKRQSK
ncbi:uncharacterized protein LOC109862170 isoform X2 [Pseudomyrmex gracilis]|uniref:uncharacterized protein LOC109862170 isoform X2 n=1 Tax=Pseudomyrmex gracilis TaxID=219809 RepID=UPI000994AE58|nr:uncharacterized protein LOC109862170 isoform X2 [Pseudomyrmex gracilis]